MLAVIPLLGFVAPARLTIVAGNHQHVMRGPDQRTTFAPLAVSLKDSSGAALAGARVAFICPFPTYCRLANADASFSAIQVTTDEFGLATLPSRLELGGGDTIGLTAVAAGTMTTFDLGVTAEPPYPDVATIISGDDQVQTRIGSVPAGGSAHFDPLVIRVTDTAGRPAAHVPVEATCSARDGFGCTYGAVIPKTTDAQGRFTLHGATAFSNTGTVELAFNGPTLAPVVFHLRVRDR